MRVPDRSQNTAAAEESEEEEPSQMSGGCDGMGLPLALIVIVWAPNAWNKGGLLLLCRLLMQSDRVAPLVA